MKEERVAEVGNGAGLYTADLPVVIQNSWRLHLQPNGVLDSSMTVDSDGVRGSRARVTAYSVGRESEVGHQHNILQSRQLEGSIADKTLSLAPKQTAESTSEDVLEMEFEYRIFLKEKNIQRKQEEILYGETCDGQ